MHLQSRCPDVSTGAVVQELRLLIVHLLSDVQMGDVN
jgi:hypothetical protein